MGPATGRLPGLQSLLPIHSGAARNLGFGVLTRLFTAHYSGRPPTDSFRHPLHGRAVTARLLGGPPPANLGRVVFLGPPHHGSEAADFWSKSAFCRWLAGPNLASLQTGLSGYSVTLGPADYEALVIAGDRPLSPFWSPLPSPHDGKVSVASTRLAGSARHVVVHHTHAALPIRTGMIRQVVQFLRGDVA